jgi:predicted O-linked N-acetylglucosamine transferase (SPINDLY family)
MQYRLSDPHLDPPEQDLSCYSEQTIRLPETYWCYAPGGETPEPSPLPADQNRHITFGSMNQFAKLSSAALDLWGEILKRTPGSRLLIHALPGEYLSATRKRFDRLGIASDRVEFIGLQAWASYISTYHRIDIGLDPFPFNGGITTCDTLLMGVPVISLSGQTPVGRGGRSILFNVGHPELLTFSPEDYVNLGVALAGDLPRLRELRKTLRRQLQSSPLMNAPRFARNVEAAYRLAWRNWCMTPG